MDRDRIQRRNFSTARRGYDPGEVDEHLRRVADEIERIREAPRPAEGLAGMAADQIKSIVDAAERSAGEIRRQAEAEAGEQVDRVVAATERLLERTDGAQAVLDRLVETLRADAGSLLAELRSSAESVRGDLEAIRAGLPELGVGSGAGPPPPGADPAGGVDAEVVGAEDEELPAREMPDEPSVDRAEPGARREADLSAAPAADEVDAAEPPEEVTERMEEPEAAGEERRGSAGDSERRAIAGSEGARLIALNMALNGASREETASYLSENFDIEDQDAVLEDVYSRMGG